MDMYHLSADECDNRIIRFNNCVQVVSCVCHVAAAFNRNLRHLARLLDLIAEIVFFATAGCMTAQVDAEMKYREGLGVGGAVASPMAPGAVLGGYAPPTVASGTKPPPYAGTPLLTETMDR